MPSRGMTGNATVGLHSPFLDGLDYSTMPAELIPGLATNTYNTAIAASSRLIALAIKASWKAGFVNVLLQTPSD